jgi:hypothetical protein
LCTETEYWLISEGSDVIHGLSVAAVCAATPPCALVCRFTALDGSIAVVKDITGIQYQACLDAIAYAISESEDCPPTPATP